VVAEEDRGEDERGEQAEKWEIFLWDPPNVTGGGGGQRVGVRLADVNSVRLALKAVRIGSVRFDL
jgi:hypothetical protein